MKDLNKILYDILLKIKQEDTTTFKINYNLIFKYFRDLNDPKNEDLRNLKIISRIFTTFALNYLLII